MDMCAEPPPQCGDESPVGVVVEGQQEDQCHVAVHGGYINAWLRSRVDVMHESPGQLN
ncbi:hypothetical protein GCM10009716_13440 [Streptomyces sodiiphilus]|uniref:Uncharacterized protein n=1 Tax=Streptomyces sodiiphilus TaxID=226217 RepID=A0ABP5A949_9ACTN